MSEEYKKMHKFKLLSPEHRNSERVTNFELQEKTKKLRWRKAAFLAVFFVLAAIVPVNLIFRSGQDLDIAYQLLPFDDAVKIKAAQVPEIAKFQKRIEIDLLEQRMRLFEDEKQIAEYPISSGRRDKQTKAGSFSIISKYPMALGGIPGQAWKMPFFMGIYTIKGTENGIHELPFINGIRESARDLGHPVSHGCVRLGIGAAEKVYNWAELGTPVIISY
ncbi:MAG: L,D-transpeptidase [bacterium]